MELDEIHLLLVQELKVEGSIDFTQLPDFFWPAACTAAAQSSCDEGANQRTAELRGDFMSGEVFGNRRLRSADVGRRRRQHKAQGGQTRHREMRRRASREPKLSCAKLLGSVAACASLGTGLLFWGLN